MISFRTLASSVLCAALFCSAGIAQDLAKYRDFQFGMSVESVAKLIHVNVTEAKTIYLRPALIQTLQWNPFGYANISQKNNAVRNIRFDFYNDALSKMVVIYDSVEIEGLTTDDLIEAISSVYGPATRPEKTIAVSRSGAYEDSQMVLAVWENTLYSYNLFRSSYGNAFGMVAFSKELELLANASGREAERLDKLEAPGRELERRKKQEEEKRLAQEKARILSKPKFRP